MQLGENRIADMRNFSRVAIDGGNETGTPASGGDYWNRGSVANFAMQDKMHALQTATPQQLLTRVDPATGEATNGIIPYADPRVTGMLRAAAGGSIQAGQPDALLVAKDAAIADAAKRKAQAGLAEYSNSQADERRNNPASFMAYVMRNGL